MRNFAALVGLWLMSGAALAAGSRVLTGRVFIQVAKSARPAVGFFVSRDGQDQTKTDSQGIFTIPLPSSRVPGKRIKLDVDKPGYCILYPPGGEVVVPEDLGEEKAVELRLLRSGSNPTRDCIANFIAETANKATRNAEKKDEPSIDASDNRSLREWAEQHHLSAEQARAEVDRWVGEVKSRPDEDPYRRALAEYAEKKFDEAARLALLAAEQEVKELAELDWQQAEKRRRVTQSYKLAGDAEYAKQGFAIALEQYGRALGYVSRAEQPEAWADLMWVKGNAHSELGTRVTGDDARAHLTAATIAAQQALTIYTRERHSKNWAALQSNLGNALAAQGIRTIGAEGRRLLGEAVATYRTALTVLTQKEVPQAWAITQNNLSATLREQGIRTGGEEGARLLGEAVAASRAALMVLTQKELPQVWAIAQTNLGNALVAQGMQTRKDEGGLFLSEAVVAYRAALTVRTQKELPQDWAQTQNNLGAALREQGIRMGGEEGARLLGQAVAAYRAALTVLNRKELPQGWAATQNNLGTALQEQGIRREGEEGIRLLSEAVVAYRAALTVRIQKELPQDWAQTQYNLGAVLREQGIRAGRREEGVRLLGEAVVAYRAALTVRTQKELPQDWAATQHNLGIALQDQGIRLGGEEGAQLLGEAVRAYRAALTVRTQKELPQDWAATQHNLGITLQDQGIRLGGEEGARLLGEAVVAHRAALTIWTREHVSPYRTLEQNNLGDALCAQGILATGDEASHLLDQAVTIYRQVLEVTRTLPTSWTIEQREQQHAYWAVENLADCAASFLKVNPNHLAAFSLAYSLNHEQLFRFDHAFELMQFWLARHPKDLDHQADFAEVHFTTAHFDAARTRLAALLARSDVPLITTVPLRALELIALVALDRTVELPTKLQALRAAIASAPADFPLTWSFNGTKHFLTTSNHPTLTAHRTWVLDLIAAMEAKDRQSLLTALDALGQRLPTP